MGDHQLQLIRHAGRREQDNDHLIGRLESKRHEAQDILNLITTHQGNGRL